MGVKRVAVTLAERGYEIWIDAEGDADARAADEIARLGYQRVALVCDETLDRLHRARYQRALEARGIAVHVSVIGEGEAHKTLATVESVASEWMAAGIERGHVAVALGGGVVGDVCGFVAAIYQRGIAYVQIPTTLLAQVDSSVGGKTAVDLGAAKNMLGAFHQPRVVFADVATLATLPARDLSAGAAEAVKHGVIADETYLQWIERHAEQIRDGAGDVLAELVEGSCRIKAAIVVADERETQVDGGRMQLNFGHTVGHAIESESIAEGAPLRHGEAVALGMIAAARVGVALGVGDVALEPRLLALLPRLGLSVDLAKWLRPSMLARARNDKKRRDSVHRFVVIPRTGSARVVRLEQRELEDFLRA